VTPEDVGEAAVPAVALAAEHGQRLGHLGPGHGVGHEGDPVGAPPLVGVAPQPDHQLHVLAHGVVGVAADAAHRLAVEEAEGAGDDEVPAEPVPAEPAEEVGAEVLHRLDPGSAPRGARTSVTRPHRTSEPFATRIVPPAASTSSPERKGGPCAGASRAR
jgi:hypothetical protein